jgi:hypothetical protein
MDQSCAQPYEFVVTVLALNGLPFVQTAIAAPCSQWHMGCL